MHFSTCVAALAAATSVLAQDGINAIKAPGQELRLIKTSEADPGRWVTEAEKLSKYVAKQRYFIDITDIKVCCHFYHTFTHTAAYTMASISSHILTCSNL